MDSSEASERFMASNWLAEMDSASRQAVLNVLVEHRAEPGTVLLEQGHPNDHIAFLIEGTAKVTRSGGRGIIEALATLNAPSLFGLTSFFRPKPPDFTVRATTPVWFLTLDHQGHDILRRVDPRAAEQLALTAVRILADRLDLLDRRITEDLADHPEDHPKHTEWASFRSRFFDDSSI
jgi:CRP-like cAMP-binding protein